MNTFLVAGGAGFIGSHLCEKLLTKGKVICIDNFITSDKKNLEELLRNKDFQFIEKDLIEPLDDIEDKLADVGSIFHLASPASPNRKSPRSYINFPIETLLVNSEGTHNLLELARKNKARFLFASTSEIYGDPEVSPQSEDYFGNVNPVGIRSVYDEAKRFGEASTKAYFRKYDVDTRIVRIFNTYGPKMQKDDGRVVSNFINQALHGEDITIYGKGDQTRSFSYVDDTVKGIILLMESEEARGEVVNIGNDDERKISEIARIIKEMVSSQSNIIFEEIAEDDPKVRQPDISKAKRILGWEPEVSLEEGLERTIEYFKSVSS